MLRFSHRLLGPAVWVATTLWTWAAPACNVPVFRYALERWEADPYEVIVFHQGPLAPDQQVLLDALEQPVPDGLANLVVTSVDLGKEMSPALRALWSSQEKPVPPWMVVRYPRRARIEPVAWAGSLTAEAVKALLDSPARREIAQRLARGDAVVWLVLESGDARRDAEAEHLLEAELRNLERSLVLPDPAQLDPPTNPDLPLKIAFSIVRVARNNPAERVLVNLLVNWSTSLATATETMLFPIFGRGRVVPPARGEEIRAEAIGEMARFLTGPCSCVVKEMNPGYDLLLAANWTSLPDTQEVPLPTPPLTGLSQFAAAATNPPAPPSNAPAVSRSAPGASQTSGGRGRLARNLAVVLGVGLVFLGATTLALKAKAGGRP